MPTAWGDPNVLVGFDGSDDAGVYRIAPDRAIAMTVDIITPIVDDPETFGRIAATNAISDIYAMGGRPLAALNIACFNPKLPAEVYSAILRGAAAVAMESGCPIVGGHTIKDSEIKFGMAVVGEVHPDRILTNRGAQPGDALILTGPIGTAALATALKKGGVAEDSDAYRAMVEAMLTSNGPASRIAVEHGAHALTDVTGFGLSGHGLEMAEGSGVALEVGFAAIPVLPGALEQLDQGFRCGGAVTNAQRAEAHLEFRNPLRDSEKEILHDPQTSGPLLLALPEDRASGALAALRDNGYGRCSMIGRVLPPGGPAFIVF